MQRQQAVYACVRIHACRKIYDSPGPLVSESGVLATEVVHAQQTSWSAERKSRGRSVVAEFAVSEKAPSSDDFCFPGRARKSPRSFCMADSSNSHLLAFASNSGTGSQRAVTPAKKCTHSVGLSFISCMRREEKRKCRWLSSPANALILRRR